MSNQSRLAVYPGTFDPITNGHIDIITRSSRLFDRLTVAVTNNPAKSPMFSVAERVELIESVTATMPSVSVGTFDGLLMHYVKRLGAQAVIRGLRAITDFEYEFQMALMNRKLAENVDAIFLMPNEKYTYLNSTIVKEVARFKGDVSAFVPTQVIEALNKKLDL